MRKIVLLILILIFIYIINYKKYDNSYFDIENYVSKIDKDNDGIDDQNDILINTKEYLNKKPKYKSKYYEKGYPDDKYGVCTDVVGWSLLNAGYDLRELVNEDINNNKEQYQIKNIDKNIDFRRVKNLNIYFKNNAIILTNDISKIEQWQGGDVVVFESHIGIISDKRNKNGVPYVLHHISPYQIFFEEDILAKRKIIGHYRIS